jgi:SagB-type dehydrogenase family enzyme
MPAKRATSNPVPLPAQRRPRLRPLEGGRVALPPHETSGAMPLETCLNLRRSVREYSSAPLRLAQLGQLLWAIQGVSGLGGLRTCPSAGAIYPLRTYVHVCRVEGVKAGLYRYDADMNAIEALWHGDRRKALAGAALGQDCVEQAAALVILASDYRRVTRELGDRGRYVTHVEAGHAGQNFLLQAAALGLGSIGLGRFEPDITASILELPEDEEPLYLLLAGHPATT